MTLHEEKLILLKALSSFPQDPDDLEAMGRYINLVECLLKVEWAIEGDRNGDFTKRLTGGNHGYADTKQ